MRRLSERSLMNAALFYLRRYAASEAQLVRVLTRKARRRAKDAGDEATDVTTLVRAVVARVVSAGYVDDARLAAAKVASLHRAGKSRRAIRVALRTKGLGERADEALSAAAPSDEDAAWTLARKKRLGPFRTPSSRAERRAKDLAALARAGFPFSVAKAVIDAVSVERAPAH